MNNELTLLIMAAGMGSRFGGLKQLEPVGPGGEFIIDYSVYDALRAGFNRVVFIIKEENYADFRGTIGSRIEGRAPVEYVFQNNLDLPGGWKVPRAKPWGTAHAIWAARECVTGPFAVINADDFYGLHAYELLARFLGEHSVGEGLYAVAGYRLRNTMTEHGAVKRGICQSDGAGMLREIIESTVEATPQGIMATPLTGGQAFTVSPGALVSMNMFAFYPDLFSILEGRFLSFLADYGSDGEKKEFLIPIESNGIVSEGVRRFQVLGTTARWQGITYREDKEALIAFISALVSQGDYPARLWGGS